MLLFVVHNLAKCVAWLMKQEPEDEFPTKLVGYFLLAWFILSVGLSVALNKWRFSPQKNMNCNPIISLPCTSMTLLCAQKHMDVHAMLLAISRNI